MRDDPSLTLTNCTVTRGKFVFGALGTVDLWGTWRPKVWGDCPGGGTHHAAQGPTTNTRTRTQRSGRPSASRTDHHHDPPSVPPEPLSRGAVVRDAVAYRADRTRCCGAHRTAHGPCVRPPTHWGTGGGAGLLLSRGGGGGEGVLDPKLGVSKMA